jgi:hypothetical protein
MKDTLATEAKCVDSGEHGLSDGLATVAVVTNGSTLGA